MLARAKLVVDYLGQRPQRFRGMAKAKMVAHWSNEAQVRALGDFASRKPEPLLPLASDVESGCLV